MVLCAIFGCGTRTVRDKGIYMARVPSVITNQGEEIRNLSEERRNKWISAISRKDLTNSILDHGRVCGRHFISGKAAKLCDRYDPDWIPTQNLGHDKCDSVEKLQADLEAEVIFVLIQFSLWCILVSRGSFAIDSFHNCYPISVGTDCGFSARCDVCHCRSGVCCDMCHCRPDVCCDMCDCWPRVCCYMCDYWPGVSVSCMADGLVLAVAFFAVDLLCLPLMGS